MKAYTQLMMNEFNIQDQDKSNVYANRYQHTQIHKTQIKAHIDAHKHKNTHIDIHKHRNTRIQQQT